MRKSTVSRFINRKYTPEFTNIIVRKFELKIGKDVSQLIMSLIQPTNDDICKVCRTKIGKVYTFCSIINCPHIICKDCYLKSSKYNKYIPYCPVHFNKYYGKKPIIHDANKFIHKYKLQFIHYIYKIGQNKRVEDYVVHYHHYRNNYIALPKRKYICCNYNLRVIENMLVIKLTDNIYDALEYENWN